MMRASSWVSSTLAAAILAGAASSAAQAPPAQISEMPNEAISETARELFAKGVKAGQEQRWDVCRAAFLAAYGVKPHPQIAGNLAACEAKLGMYRDAAEHVSIFLRSLRPDAPEERRASGEAVLREASAKITTVRLDVDRTGAEVLVDGRPIGNAPITLPIFLEPGAHRIEAHEDGYVTARRSVDATAGAVVDVELKLAPLVAPQAPVVVAEKRPLWPVVVGGVLAVGGLAAGAGLTVAANGKASDRSAFLAKFGSTGCTQPAAATAVDCAKLLEAAKAQSVLAHGAMVGFVGGGFLALATAGLGVWAGSKPMPKAVQIQVVPALGATEHGVLVVGTW